MAGLTPCANCSRHVKPGDARCPFCGASNARISALEAHARQSRRSFSLHVSRSQWLAIGSALSLARCSASVPLDGSLAADAGNRGDASGSSSSPEAASPAEAGGAPEGSVAADTGGVSSGEGGFAVCAARSGYFVCGSEVCDRSIQACVNGMCSSYGAAYGTIHLESCGDCPTCDCVSMLRCTCNDDGAGGITLLSCAGCYGAPPPRAVARA